MAGGGGGDQANGSQAIQDKKFLLGALAIVLILTFADFFGGGSSAVSEANAQKVPENPTPKFATKFMGPSIKFLYW